MSVREREGGNRGNGEERGGGRRDALLLLLVNQVG